MAKDDPIKELFRGLRPTVEEALQVRNDFEALLIEAKEVLDAIEESGFEDSQENRQSLVEGAASILAALLTDPEEDEEEDDDDD
jgi:hypothetical protein